MKFSYSIVFIIIFLFFSLLCIADSFENDIIFSEDTKEHVSPGRMIAEWLIDHNVNPYTTVLIIAMLPVVELRGAIPVGIAMGLKWEYVILFSILGNMIPIFFILFLLKPVEKIFRKIRIFDAFFIWLYKRTLRKSKSVEKYEQLGLMFFVSIPLPVTGAWTGSLIAYLLKFKYFMSIVFIFAGVCIAAFIVSTITFLARLGFEKYGFFGFSAIILVFIIIFIILSVKNNKRV